MKNKIITQGVTFLLLMLLSASSLIAQNREEELNRDARIALNILEELIKNEASKMGKTSRSIAWSSNSIYTAQYIPGYGIALNLVEGLAFNEALFFTTNKKGDTPPPPPTEGNEMDNAFLTFFKDYSIVLRKLNPTERVTIEYSGIASATRRLEKIKLTVTAKDITDFREGRLSESEFKKRLTKTTGNEDLPTDIKVMAGILETAIKEDEKIRVLQVKQSHLPGFGALFTLRLGNVSSGAQISVGGGLVLTERLEIVASKKTSEEIKEERAEREEKAKAAIKNVTDLIKTYLLDYGATLGSVKEDERVEVQLTFTSTFLSEDERASTITVPKSVLTRYSKNGISRAEALNAFSIK